jgi:hypothetical protein
MMDEPSSSASPTPESRSPQTTSSARQPPIQFNIGEEFGTAKRSFPPTRILLICIAAVAIVAAIVAYLERAKPQGAGSIDYINAVEVPGQNTVLAAITLRVQNSGEKALWIHSLKARLTDSGGKTYDDEAASGVDLDRYAQAFPVLKENSQPPLLLETKLMPGAEQKGTLVVSFPVTKQAFDQRKSIAVTIQPYDQVVPIVLVR